MFRNKILLRIRPPFSPFSSLSLLQLSLSEPFPLSPSFSSKLHSLCWKLSRKWRLACFSHSSDEIYIVFQKTQSDSAAQVVREIKEALPVSDVLAGDREVMSGSLLSKAVDCSLRSVLLENNWKCVGDGYIVNSSFSRGKEKSHVHALDVTIQVDTADAFIVLSPDVVQFGRHKIMDLLGPEMERRFNGGEEHGLELPNDHFMKIQFTNGGHMIKQWFPSAFVLKGSGLTPVPQSIRASNAICALESFMAVIEAWNFFDGGLLKIEGVCRLGTGSDLPSWTKAGYNNGENFLTASSNSYIKKTIEEQVPSFKGLLSSLDFRTPKPASGLLFGREPSEHYQIQGSTMSKATPGETQPHINYVVSMKADVKLKPFFMKRKCATKSIHSESIPDCTAGKEKLVSSEALAEDLKTKKDAAIRKDDFCDKICSKTLKQKKTRKEILSCSEDAGIEDLEQKKPKKRAKHCADPSDITAKVNDYRARGQLGSLTVPELKSFLSTRKAKVGGKKEDLIQRIVALLT